MPSKLLHLLGGGQWQLPTVQLAKSLGYRVLVTDIYEERPAYACADAHAVVDITDRENTLRVAREHRVDGIICDTTDVGVPTMAYVAEQLGLPGIGLETALNFTDKSRMREITSAAGVPNPPFRVGASGSDAARAARDIGLPVVVKPVDNQSSRGVHIVRTREQLDDAVADALACSRQRRVLVEGFLDGTEVTVEGYCIDGQPYVAGISDKDHFPHRPEVANRLTYPADFRPEILERIRDVNCATVRALGLDTGVTHAEYMVVDSQPHLVEIAARGGGSRVYSHIAPYLAGFPVPKFYLNWCVGRSTPHMRKEGERAANLAFFNFPEGRIWRISGVEEAARMPGVQEILVEVAEGETIQRPIDDRSRPGLAVIFGRTRGEVLETTARVMETVRVDVE